jgi:hypothetical protein
LFSDPVFVRCVQMILADAHPLASMRVCLQQHISFLGNEMLCHFSRTLW